MKTRPSFLRAFYLLILLASAAWAEESPSPAIVRKPSSLPDFPPISEAVVGVSHSIPMVLGRTSPQEPFSTTLWTLPPEAKLWNNTKFERNLSGLTTTSDEEGLICVGGRTPQGLSAEVFRLRTDEGKVVVQTLPSLPQPLIGSGAAVVGHFLYVFGGLSSLEPMTYEKGLWKLDLTKLESGWKREIEFPGPARAFAAVTSQYNMVCVFGGLVAPSEAGAAPVATNEAWAYRPIPLEGTKLSGWVKRSDVPLPTVAATALPLGQGHVLILAGQVNQTVKELFPKREWPSTPSRSFFYHTITDAWIEVGSDIRYGQVAAAKSGANVLLLNLGVPSDSTSPPPVFSELTFPSSARSLVVVDYIIIAAYFSLMFGIGIYFSRKQETSAEFSLGSRNVPWWAAGISMYATGASAISFMAIPALAFATSLVWLLPVLMMIPAYFILSRSIFLILRRLEITSTYEYLERRFNTPMRLIASGVSIVLQVFGRAAIVLFLPSLAISTTTGLPVVHCVILMGVLTTIYTAMGGFQAVIWTEVFQGFIKLVAPVLMILVALAALPGGYGEFVRTGISYHKFDYAIFSWDLTVPSLWIMLINMLVILTLVPAGDQPTVQRIFSAPMKEVRRVTAMNCICGIFIAGLVNLVGIVIFAYFHAHPEKFYPGAQNDQIVPLFVTQAAPAGISGLVIAAIFASAMATVASSMNSVATIITEDFYLRMRPQATDKARLRMLKMSSYSVGILATVTALYLATQNIDSLMKLWSIINAVLSGGIVGVFTLGIFTRRANGFGAICGALISIALMIYLKFYTPLHWQTFMPIAISSCVISGYLFSMLFPQNKNIDGLTAFTPAKKAVESL